MSRIKQLQKKHNWLSTEEARFVLVTRYWKFSRELGMSGDALNTAMDNCVRIYTKLPEPAMRDMLARFQEHFMSNY